MAIQTESRWVGAAIVAQSAESLETVTVVSGSGVLEAGTVLGEAGWIAGRAVGSVAGTGNGTVSDVLTGPQVLTGSYVLTCIATATHGGTFRVVAPDGSRLPDLVLTPGAGVATRYETDHIALVVTDGSTDFALNDTITIVVSGTAPTVEGTGNGTISAIALGPDAECGTYRYICTAAVANGGRFEIVGPRSQSLGSYLLTVGAGAATVIRTRHLTATITDGTTDFAVGDTFRVVVSRSSYTLSAPYAPRTHDGRSRLLGVLYRRIDASTTAARATVLVRAGVVARGALTYTPALQTAEQAAAERALHARGIAVR